jgi:rhodanese-related sulfurtransferase
MASHSHSSISAQELGRHIGTQRAPVIVDIRSDGECERDPFLIPGSVRRRVDDRESWAMALAGRSVVVTCSDGGAASQGVSASLRSQGIGAQTLDGGFGAWRSNGNLMTNAQKIPDRDAHGRTVWVTRERPKIDRIACPWLLRRFVDPEAVFLFVDPTQVAHVAERFKVTPFDIEDVFWSHRNETCSFDSMLVEFGLKSPALDHLADIVRGADTARLDLAPQASGFLAASLGLSQLFDDDLEQLKAGLTLYDAMYLWCRDGSAETHNWPTKLAGGKS